MKQVIFVPMTEEMLDYYYTLKKNMLYWESISDVNQFLINKFLFPKLRNLGVEFNLALLIMIIPEPQEFILKHLFKKSVGVFEDHQIVLILFNPKADLSPFALGFVEHQDFKLNSNVFQSMEKLYDFFDKIERQLPFHHGLSITKYPERTKQLVKNISRKDLFRTEEQILKNILIIKSIISKYDVPSVEVFLLNQKPIKEKENATK